MKPKHQIVFLLGKANGYLEKAMTPGKAVAESWVDVAKAMEVVAFCAGMADARAFWRSQRKTAATISGIASYLLNLVLEGIRFESPCWTDGLKKVQLDIETLSRFGSFR